MINEKKLIDRLWKRHREVQNNDDDYSNKEAEIICAEICNIVSIIDEQPKTDWIPCEERLPSEENEEYLICTNEAHVRILFWTKRGWNTFIGSEGKYYTDAEIKNVIAWQPLPQPYEEEGAE